MLIIASKDLALGEVGSRVNVYKTITVMITADKSHSKTSDE